MPLYGACKRDQLKNIGGLKIRIIRYSSMKVSGSKTYAAIFLGFCREMCYIIHTHSIITTPIYIKKIKYDYGH